MSHHYGSSRHLLQLLINLDVLYSATVYGGEIGSITTMAKERFSANPNL